MSLFLQKSLPNSTTQITHFHSNITHFKNPHPLFFTPHNSPQFPSQSHTQINHRPYPLLKIPNSWRRNHRHSRVYQSYSNHELTDSNFDAFLSIVEVSCVVSSVVVSVGCVVNWICFKGNNVGLIAVGNRVLVWLLSGALAVGAVIRRRQWRRIGSVEVGTGVVGEGNLVERIEKLEENLKSSTSIVRMLSRQLEKLGIRFRVTKKALKEPIDETAALCQKNSEATRTLALQADILERELGEVQRVLLAMQDQQQKQLELILAIAKAGKLYEADKESDARQAEKPTDGRPKQADSPRIQAVADNNTPSKTFG